MKQLVSNYYMIDLLMMVLTLLTAGTNAQAASECGAEIISLTTSGTLGHTEYMFQSSKGTYSKDVSKFAEAYFTVTDLTDSCSTLTYAITNSDGTAYDGQRYSVTKTSQLSVVITDTFEAETVKLKATTVGGVSASVSLTFGVVDAACSYMQSGTSSHSLYINPSIANNFNWKTDFPCQFTTMSDSCPLTHLIKYTDDMADAAGATAMEYKDQIIAADTYSAGDKKTQYYAAGLLGDRFDDSILVAAITVCSFSYYSCGNEEIALADSGTRYLHYVKNTKSTTQVWDNTALAEYFSLSHTATDSYSDCGFDSYELLDANDQALTDSSVVTYDAQTGLTMYVNADQSRFFFKIKAITKGGKSIAKTFQLNVYACGAETIAANTDDSQKYGYFWGAYAVAGSTKSFTSTTHESFFVITNSPGSACNTLTYYLYADDGVSTWDDSYVYLDTTTGRLVVDYGIAFGTKKLKIQATTPGDKSAMQSLTIISTESSSDCTYSAAMTTSEQFFNPAVLNQMDPSALDCGFSSSDSKSTACPLSAVMDFNTVLGSQDDVKTVIPYLQTPLPANLFPAGSVATQYLAVGLPGVHPKYLKISSNICTQKTYFCGKETVSLATKGALTVKQGKVSNGNYVMTEDDLAALFTVDTSADDAYDGCKTMSTYELVTDATGNTTSDDTTYASFTTGTGLSWDLNTAVDSQAIFLKATTIGGISGVKEFTYSVIDCGSEATISKVASLNNNVYRGMFNLTTGGTLQYTEAMSKAYYIVSGASEAACETLRYALTANGRGLSHDNIKLSTAGYLQINYTTVWGIQDFSMKASTPGGASIYLPITAIVVQSGCTYTLGRTTSQDFYIDPTAAFTIDYNSDSLSCVWTSSNDADTNCPLKYSLFYNSASGTSGDMNSVVKHEDDAQTVKANTYEAGYVLTNYRAVGLPAYSVDKTHLVRGDICTEKYYMCGKEVVSLVDDSAFVLTKGQDSSWVSNEYHMLNATFVEWFQVDTSDSSAYDNCGLIERYELCNEDGTKFSTSAVAEQNSTGITFKLSTQRSDYELYVKLVTKGGVTQLKKISYNVVSCGSETIVLKKETPHVEAIYATGVSGDTYKILAADLLSNYFTITDDSKDSMCSVLTNTLVDSNSRAYTDSAISINSNGDLVINIENAFAVKNFYLKATTVGSKNVKQEFKIMVTNSGCTYSHSGEETINEYFKASDAVDYDFTTNDCKFTSTKTNDTDCPLYRIMYTDVKGDTMKTDAAVTLLSENLSIARNTYEAGKYPGAMYYKVGLPGNPFESKLLSEASVVCTLKPHFCGLEKLTASTDEDLVLELAQSDTENQTYSATDINKWYILDTSGFNDTSGANWTGCGINTYGLYRSSYKQSWRETSKAVWDSDKKTLEVKLGTVQSFILYMYAETITGGTGQNIIRKVTMNITNSCGDVTLTVSSTPTMTNKLTVGKDSYDIYEKVAYIGAKSSTATAAISTDVTFTSSLATKCPLTTWELKESLTATTSLQSGKSTEALTQSFATDVPAILNYYYSASTEDSVSKTINYKIAVCGLEKVNVSDSSEVKIIKYYNEFKKDYHSSKYYAESIYSTWFAQDTTTLVTDELVADSVEADMFKNGCPINDYMLCEDADCSTSHSKTSLFYLDYQTQALITSDGTLNADGTEPATTSTRRILATSPTIPYTDDSFNITKTTTRNTTELYSRIVMKVDTLFSQTAYLAALTTGYAKNVRQITFENKCGLEYVYPSKTSYEYQLQTDNGLFSIQASDYQSWFESTFTACPIVKYELRSFSSTVTVDDKLKDGTYLKFTDEYLTSQSVTDTTIVSVPLADQQVTDASGATVNYTFCHNNITDAGVACDSGKQGGWRLDEYDFPTDDIMRRVEILDTGILQIDTDKAIINSYNIDLVAISEGGAEGFAHIYLDIIAKRIPPNIPPFFESTPPELIIDKVDDTTQQVYVSPQASDLDGQAVTISVSGNEYDFITITTTSIDFTLEIDHSKITEDLDGNSFTLTVELTDGEDTTSYSVQGTINWKVPAPEPIPEEKQAEPEKVEEIEIEQGEEKPPPVEEIDVMAEVEIKEEEKMELQEDEVEVKAEVAPWQEFVPAETMKEIFAEYKPPLPPPPIAEDGTPKKKKRKNKVKDQPVTRDGSFGVGFSQKMKVPDFITNSQSPKRSRLLANGTVDPNGNKTEKIQVSLDQLDVTRDICDVRFILASEIDPKDIKYFLVIKKWDETGLDIFVNFTDPLQISRGDDRDVVEISIKRPGLFISAETGEMLDTSSLVFYQTLPRQLPKGVSEKSVKDDAEDVAAALNSMAYVQIGLQFMIKGIMADLMTTFYCLQLCCFFTIYKVNIPGNSEIYIDEFRKLINMDAAKPDNVLSSIDEDYSIDYFMNLSKERVNSAAESSGMNSTSFVKNMSTFIFIGTIIFFGIILLAAMTTLKSRFQVLFKEKLNSTLNKMFFNGQIKAQTVSYLKTSIAFSTSMQYMNFASKTNGELWAEVGIPTLIVVVYPFVCLFVLVKFRAHLSKARLKKKISNMYEGVHLTRNKFTILYYPMYLIRRLVFVCIPLMFWFESAFQVQILFFVNYAFSIFFFAAQPIADPVKNKMQMYNEGMMLAITYHMFYFTDFADSKYQFLMGYSFVLTLCAILFVNIFKMAHNSFVNWLSARRQQANQKAYEKAYNDWVTWQINAKKNRKADREKKRLEKIERAKKAMQMFQESSLIVNLKADILRRQKLKEQEDAQKKVKGALSSFFQKAAGKGKGINLLAPKAASPVKIKPPKQADLLKLTLGKKLNLTKINETEGEEGTQRNQQDIFAERQRNVEKAKVEFDKAFKKMFANDDSDSEEVELTEEEIKLNKLVSQLSFLDRSAYRKNNELVNKFSQMNQQISFKKNKNTLSLMDTIDLLDSINKEFKMILPKEAIRIQHQMIIGDYSEDEHSDQKETPEQQFDIYQNAIQNEIEQINMKQDRIEKKNKVGKYQHLKEEEKKVEENVFDLDAEELAIGVPVNEDEDSDVDLELPERLRNKKKNQVKQFDKDDILTGVAIMGVGTGGLVAGRSRDDRDEEVEDAMEEMQEEEEAGGGEGFNTDYMFSKMKFMGASGLVYAGLLEPSDLPPNPDEDENKEEEKKEEDLEDEDSGSDFEDDDDGFDDDDEGNGRGKKKKKRGGAVDLEDEEEEAPAEDY